MQCLASSAPATCPHQSLACQTSSLEPCSKEAFFTSFFGIEKFSEQEAPLQLLQSAENPQPLGLPFSWICALHSPQLNFKKHLKSFRVIPMGAKGHRLHPHGSFLLTLPVPSSLQPALFVQCWAGCPWNKLRGHSLCSQ